MLFTKPNQFVTNLSDKVSLSPSNNALERPPFRRGAGGALLKALSPAEGRPRRPPSQR
jgi:hypothetical protein